MDRKAIIVVILSLVLLVLWYPLVSHLYPPTGKSSSPPSKPAGSTTNRVSVHSNAPATSSTTPAAEAPVLPKVAPFQPTEPEQQLTVSNAVARYTFTSYGGGIKLIELTDYPESVACNHHSTNSNVHALATLNTAAPTPVFGLQAGNFLHANSIYRLERVADGVRASATFTNGLRVVKEYHLGTNYLFDATLRLENESGQPLDLPVQELFIGTSTPIGPHDNARRMGLHWYNGQHVQKISESYFANRTLGCIPGQPRSQYVAGSSNIVWAAVNNQFFAIVAMPPANSPAPRLLSQRIELPPPSLAELKADHSIVAKPFGFQSGFLYPRAVLAPGKQLSVHLEFYAGPKEYRALARISTEKKNNLDLLMDYGGFFGLFSKALLLSMNFLHRSLRLPYGLAIIAITVIIKLLFWPLTRASTRSMKRMSALQPQMKALQEKYKDDPKRMNAKLMEFMKQNRVNPLGGCIPMLIQIPVFIGFFYMIQSAIELRGASFLWACDLTQPDTVFVIPFLNFPLNLFPLIMGATQLWQMSLTPPSPGVDPLQQKIMRFMPMMILVFLYNYSSALTLYWTVQNLLSVLQMKLTKNDTPPPAAGSAPLPVRPGRGPKRKK